MLKVQGMNITYGDNGLKYEKTGDISAATREMVHLHKNTIAEYLKTFQYAGALADIVDGHGEYQDRVKRLPELLALVDSMRITEMHMQGKSLKEKALSDRKLFLSAFPGVKTFQTFDDSKEKRKYMTRILHGSPELDSRNRAGAGIFLTINETDGHGREAHNIVKVRSVFGDLDGAPLAPVWDYKPSMVVESSPGKHHVYFMVDDKFPLEGFTQLQEAIATTFNSDPKVKDLPRVMRVPGYMHQKGAPFLSRIIHYSGEVHDFGYLTDMFPPAPVAQWSAPEYQKSSFNDSEFNGNYGASEGERNCHITKRVGGMLRRGLSWPEIEAEAMKEGAACSPQLSEKEVLAILKSMRRYA